MAVTPTPEQTQTMIQAVIAKATRFLALPNSPMGAWGEYAEGGVATITVRPDHSIKEMLYGLGGVDWDIDLPTEVTTDMVIRVGLQTDPADFPAEKVVDVQRAIDSAIHWIAQYLLSNGVGV